MNKIKSIIIVLGILILIVIIILAILLLNIKIKDEKIYNQDTEKVNIKEVFKEENKISKVDNFFQYFKAKDCIDSYLMFSRNLYYAKNNENENIDNINAQMLSIFPDFVKKELNINNNNLYEVIGLPDKYMRIDSIYTSRQTINEEEYMEDTNINAYLVEGVFIDINKTEDSKEEFKIIVLIDEINSTFYIIPQKYIEKKNISINEGSALNIYSESEIKDNTYNTYQTKAYTDQDICEEYFNTFRLNIEYDPESVYNKLDKKYREKRFENYNNFVKYIKDNDLKTIKIQSYLVNRYDDYNEYVCKDQFGNYYIFNEIAVKDYTLTLDTYTLEQQKFNEEYNKATNQKKVMMNIDKFFQMINAKDYKSAYKLLDDNFKNNYFKTVDIFENYMKQRVFSYNDVEYVAYNGDISGIFTYKINLKNRLDDTQQVEFSIVMQLKEGTDFVMSFNVQ